MLELAGAECGPDSGGVRWGVVYEAAGGGVWATLGRTPRGEAPWIAADWTSESLREPAAIPGSLNGKQ